MGLSLVRKWGQGKRKMCSSLFKVEQAVLRLNKKGWLKWIEKLNVSLLISFSLHRHLNRPLVDSHEGVTFAG